MKIILAPAKKMRTDADYISYNSMPQYIDKTQLILDALKDLSHEELKKVWNCNESIVQQNIQRLNTMDLTKNLTPAILAYDGIAFQYMAPSVFEDKHFDYIERNLLILSGFYGALRPLDAVTPYRLEMQAKLSVDGHKNLYDFWGDLLYKACENDRVIINLASKEYSKCIEKYLTKEDTLISCSFCENVNGKLKQKATFAKMARGEMVRFLAENNIQAPEGMKSFNRLNFHFRDDLSTDIQYVFERIPEKKI